MKTKSNSFVSNLVYILIILNLEFSTSSFSVNYSFKVAISSMGMHHIMIFGQREMAWVMHVAQSLRLSYTVPFSFV